MKTEDFSENELIEQAKNGDENAIATIYNKYKNFVFSIAYKMLRNWHDTEDAVSETFLKFLTNVSKIKTSLLFSWFSTTTKNVCYDMLNKKHKSKNVIPIDDVEDTLLENTISEFRQCKSPPDIYKDKQELNKILDKLPKLYKDVLLLHYNDGYSCKEIANMLGKTENAIKLILFKAKKRVKND